VWAQRTESVIGLSPISLRVPQRVEAQLDDGGGERRCCLSELPLHTCMHGFLQTCLYTCLERGPLHETRLGTGEG
jgi:hypothetical protein